MLHNWPQEPWVPAWITSEVCSVQPSPDTMLGNKEELPRLHDPGDRALTASQPVASLGRCRQDALPQLCRPVARPHSLVGGDPAQVGGSQAVATLLPSLRAGHFLQ